MNYLGLYGGLMTIVGIGAINLIGITGYVFCSTIPLVMTLMEMGGMFE